MSDTSHDLPRRDFLLGAGAAAATLISSDSRAAEEPGSARPGHVDPQSGLAGVKQLLTGKNPVVWLITGDSITHGALHTLGWRSYPEHFAERVRWELKRVRDIVINTGISGDRTGGMLKDIDWRILQFRPQAASIMLGMNDCTAGPSGRETFRANLTAIVEKLQVAGTLPILHTQNTIYLKNAMPRADLPAYAQITREVAEAKKTLLVDHYAHWEKAKPDQEQLLPWLEDKSIHPGVYGHREFAKLFFKQLEIYDENSPTCRLEVP
jgi:acyl-CoA thioesterase I